uniref:Protein CIP2A n=2 Tax=Schistocephalus solidus TaxID=70667 RepID=A0A0X3NSV5_SCHSO
MRLLLRCAAMAINRLAQSVVGLDAESLEMSADQSFRLAILVQSIAQQLFAGNDVLAVITGLADESAAATSVDAKQQSPPDTINLVQKAAVLAKAGLTVECLDLMLACINHLSAVSPAPPPRSQSGIEDASETRIDSTPRLVENMTGLCLQEEASAARLRRCGDALQHFLERPVMPSLLALTLAEGDGLFLPSGAPLTCPVAAWNYSLRLSALRLLPLALQLEKFSNQAFTDTLVALLPPDLGVVDRYLTSKLQSQAQQKPDSRSPAFLTTWLLCTQPLGPSSYTESSRGNQRQSNCTEEVLEKLLSRMDGMEVSSVSGSEALAICQRTIELLKSREGAVEANLNAKNEALTAALRESDQIVEQLRTRALLAEAEALRLANLQLTALTERERDRTTLADLTSQLNRLKAMNADLSNDLAAKRQDCENLLATKQNLQSKLANSREQIRALDATNDNYRKQLDEAKQLLQQKDVQIQQYTQITRLINDLTGNRAPAIDLAASIQLPNKTPSTNP